MKVCFYPEWLEKWWLDQARAVLDSNHGGNDSLEFLDSIVSIIQQMSDLFTKDRPKGFKDYILLDKELMAYGLFFNPQSFVRALYPLIEVIHYWDWRVPFIKEERGEVLNILDVGSGVGGASMGMIYLLKKLYPQLKIKLTVIDHSLIALQTLKRVYEENVSFLGTVDIEVYGQDIRKLDVLKKKGEKFDLVVFGFSLNEMIIKMDMGHKVFWVNELREVLEERGMIFILEPALKETAENLQLITDELIKKGEWYRWGPYVSQRACPMIHKGLYWNHEVRAWQPPESLCFLNRHLFRSVGFDLKYAYTAVSLEKSSRNIVEDKNYFRLVSPMSIMKGEFLMSGVAGDGLYYTYHLPTRGMSKHEIKKIQEQFERGDILKIIDFSEYKDKAHIRIDGLGEIGEHFSAKGELMNLLM